MAVELIGGLVFDAMLTCPGKACGYREKPYETVEAGRALVDRNWRDEEFVAYRCFGCGRLRYVDECLSVEKIRRVELADAMDVERIPAKVWGDDGEE